MSVIYVITPTNNARVSQMADMTRLRNTLWLVPKIVWIVIEDSDKKTSRMAIFLHNSKIPYIHLSAATPSEDKLNENDISWKKPRSVLQRNQALTWLRDHQNELHQQ